VDFTDYVRIFVFVTVLVASAPLLGALLGRLLEENDGKVFLNSLEPWIFGVVGSSARSQMNWVQYAMALMAFNAVGFIALLAILMLQGYLPLNPQSLPNVPFWLALNTAVSFVTNTNWQAYSGEATLSYFSQMVGLTTQNFVSAATGIAVVLVLARGLVNSQKQALGNFWRDLIRVTVYVLLPLSIIWAIALVSQGVVQSFSVYVTAHPVFGGEQLIPLGPAASQIAIKQLGTNGGGFFGVNSAHPFENPTSFSNFLQVIAILLIPAALPFTYGRLVGNPRHGLALFGAMFFLFSLSLILALVAENLGHPALNGLPLLEGKEQRIGIGDSVLWGIATTVASNGSVNSMISSFSPAAGGIALLNMMLGEVVFGGVGSGLYGMVLFAIITVFIAGLMVGRTPEYLGKKIEAPEVRFAAIALVLPSAVVLILSALAISTESGLSSLLHKGPHGLTEILYAFTSAANNNGSAFAGLSANTAFYNGLTALTMAIGRYGVILPVLFIAGRLATKKTVPVSMGTFETHGWLFTVLLCSVVFIVGALTFFPALSLGPIIEQILLMQGRVL
jgi:potassium-transporting ATPase potassium-binding subunit